MRLQLDRHLGELVQEQRASVGALEETRMPAHGACEAALLVPEKLARCELARQRAAVDGDELAWPRARSMNRLRDELFARARLTKNQHGARRAGDLFDLLVDGEHRRRLADETPEVQVAVDARRAAVLRARIGFHGAQELRAADRL